MDEWERHVTPLLQDMGCSGDGHEDFFNPQELLVQGGQPTTGASATSPGASSAHAPSLSPAGSAPGGLAAGGASSPGGAGCSVPCCEGGRPIMTDPVSGQTVCSCQYDQARLALSAGYPRLSGGVGVYGTPYPSTDQNPYPSIGVDSSAFYSPLSNPYALKDGSGAGDMSAWTSAGLQPTTGYYPYDPTLAAYGYGAGYDLAARRKNATRESTATLKAWLNEHKKNPYPTKGEKIMLAIITKMTLTQVSTWFANARRRLKKENKMTWEPKNKTDDDDEAMVSDDEKDKDDLLEDKMKNQKDSMHHVKSEHHQQHHGKPLDDDDDLTDDERKSEEMMGHHGGHGMGHGHHGIHMMGGDCGVPIPATKPKIWSLADTAACKTPPPPVPQGWAPSHYPGNFAPPQGYGYGRHPTQHQQQSGNGQQSCVLPAGFPEVQTDTPPQTPPSMKLPGAAPHCVGGTSAQGSSYPSPPPHRHHRDECHPDMAAFKPFYKNSQHMNSGFVSPV